MQPAIPTAQVEAFESGGAPLRAAARGGLVAVRTTLDPAASRDDALVGSVVGAPGSLPPMFSALHLDTVRGVPDLTARRASDGDYGEDGERDGEGGAPPDRAAEVSESSDDAKPPPGSGVRGLTGVAGVAAVPDFDEEGGDASAAASRSSALLVEMTSRIHAGATSAPPARAADDEAALRAPPPKLRKGELVRVHAGTACVGAVIVRASRRAAKVGRALARPRLTVTHGAYGVRS